MARELLRWKRLEGSQSSSWINFLKKLDSSPTARSRTAVNLGGRLLRYCRQLSIPEYWFVLETCYPEYCGWATMTREQLSSNNGFAMDRLKRCAFYLPSALRAPAATQAQRWAV